MGATQETANKTGGNSITQQQSKRQLKRWINLHSKGEDGFTALHFASFNGNITMIELLCEHGSSIDVVSKIGINMLHVAAQGD